MKNLPANKFPESLREYNGNFYASDWTEIYCPLDIFDHKSFVERVLQEETKKGRKLTNQELLSISDEHYKKN